MIILEVALSALICLAAGSGPVALGLFRSRQASWSAWLGASYIVGFAVIGTVTTVLMMAGIPVGAWVAIVLAAIGTALALAFRPRLLPPGLADRRSWIPVLLAGAAAAVLLAGAGASRHLRRDGGSFWLLKAKSIERTGTFRNSDFRDPDRLHWHAGYPLAMPSVYALAYRVAGDDAERLIRFALALFFLASLALLAALARDRLPEPLAGWLVAAFAWMPVFGRPDTGLVDGFVDYPLGVFILLGLVGGRDWLERGRRESAIFSALMLACASQTKNEGGGFMAVAVVVFALFGAARAGWRGALAGAAIPAAGLALFVAWSVMSASFVPDPVVVRWGLPVHWDRALTVWHRLIVALGKISKWGVFWYAAFLAGLAKRPSLEDPDSLLAWAGVGFFLECFAGWLLQPAEGASNAMGSNSIRLALQAAPTFFVWLTWRLAAFPSLRDWGAAEAARGEAA